MTIDVWMQHPTLGFLRHDMFASLRRWTGAQIEHALAGLAALELDAETRELFLTANARRVFALTEGAARSDNGARAAAPARSA